MTRNEYIQYWHQILGRDLSALAQLHPEVTTAAAGGKILDPFLEAVRVTFAHVAADAHIIFDTAWPGLTRRALALVAPHAAAVLPPLGGFELRPPAGTDKPLQVGQAFCLRPATRAGDDVASCAFRPPRWPSARPWRVSEVEYATGRTGAGGAPVPVEARVGLRVVIEPTPGAKLPRCRRLRLFCTAEDDAAPLLLHALFAEGVGVFARRGRGEWQEAAVRPVGFGTELLPPGRALPSRCALQQFFAYPALYHFFDVLLAETAKSGPGPLTLFFAFSKARPELAALTSLARDDHEPRLRLNCVPALNLMERHLDVSREDGRAEYDLRLSGGDFEIHSVEEVREVWRDAAAGLREQAVLRRGNLCGEADAAFTWEFVRGAGLQLLERPGAGPARPGSRLDVRVLCTSRDHAARIGPGTPMDIEAEGADGWTAVPLFKPTAALRPPDGAAAAECLEAHLAPARLGLFSRRDAAEALRSRLRTAAFDGWSSTPTLGSTDPRPADAARAIAGVVETAVTRRNGRPVVDVRLDPLCYPNGASWLFREALRRFLREDWLCGPHPVVRIRT
jgi:type VI protein secretion system component VasA